MNRNTDTGRAARAGLPPQFSPRAVPERPQRIVAARLYSEFHERPWDLARRCCPECGRPARRVRAERDTGIPEHFECPDGHTFTEQEGA